MDFIWERIKIQITRQTRKSTNNRHVWQKIDSTKFTYFVKLLLQVGSSISIPISKYLGVVSGFFKSLIWIICDIIQFVVISNWVYSAVCIVLAFGRIKKPTKVSVSHVKKILFFAQNVNFIVFHRRPVQAGSQGIIPHFRLIHKFAPDTAILYTVQQRLRYKFLYEGTY